MVQPGEHDDLDDLLGRVVSRQRDVLGIRQRAARMQRVGGREQYRLGGVRPLLGGAVRDGWQVGVGEARGGPEEGDVHAPFVVGAAARGGALDHQLARAG